MLLTAVIPTKNEGRNIRACIESFLPAVREGWGEVIVVDNGSEDDTVLEVESWKLNVERSASSTETSNIQHSTSNIQQPSSPIRILQKGPERSAQRNEGWRQARGEYVFFVDADMRVPEETLREIQRKIQSTEKADAYFVREVRIGDGWWTRVRNFERSFYDATCIDALRVIRRSVLEQVEGYDETMTGPEDWDLDRKILQVTQNVALTDGHLLHDEQRLTFRRLLQKKAYYSGAFEIYQRKWNHDAVIRKQFGLWYRFFGVFLEKGKWKRVVTHPHYMVAIWFERMCVGMVYLTRRKKHAQD